MATNKPLSAANLGTVLETYGGKALKRIITVGTAIFVCSLTAALVLRVFRSDYFVLATVILGLGLVVALAYVRLKWDAALAKVEVCGGGVRLLWRDGAMELPWDRILKVQAGYLWRTKGRPEHVVIRTTDGDDIELLLGFWDAVGGASRFATTVRRFVKDVEVDVKFVREK